ncbi:MAG: 5-carboxymethyl-2-hydroxymuconate Delta-isomerase [Legionella sp.]|nr:5-carboxymethyl-2-hydroxymuconate Delta-isomerase [Legionella sp.]
MPHLILEYSDNIPTLNCSAFFQQAHLLLAKELPTQLSSCKSRCIVHEAFYVGDGSEQNAFAHLTIKILAGRTDEKKNYIGNELLKIMSEFFQADDSDLKTGLSVEILDLDPHYFKKQEKG